MSYFQHIREHKEVSRKDITLIHHKFTTLERMLDIGCGVGGFLEACEHHFPCAIGLDIVIEATQECRNKGLHVIIGDSEHLPLRKNSFDVVRAKEILEHLADPTRLLVEARRVLRPGGLLLVHVPSHYSMLYPIANFYDDYTHVRPLTKFGLTRLLTDTGFKVLGIEGYTVGRSPLERILGRAVATVLPHTWRALATKPE